MRWSWFLGPVALSYLCAAAVLAITAFPLLVPILAIGPVLPLLALGAVDVLPRLLMIEHRIPSVPKGLREAGVVAAIGLVAGNLLSGRGLVPWRTDLLAVGTRELVVWASFVVLALAVLSRTAHRTVTGTLANASGSAGEPLDVWPDRPTPRPVADTDVRRVDVEQPAVWTVDDGRVATICVTAGALDVLDPAEQRAVVAREAAVTVDATPAVAFWLGGLPPALDEMRASDSRSRRLLFVLGDVLGLFGLITAATGAPVGLYEQRTVTDCDRAGAIIVDDARGLASALGNSRVDETPGNASWPERTGEN